MADHVIHWLHLNHSFFADSRVTQFVSELVKRRFSVIPTYLKKKLYNRWRMWLDGLLVGMHSEGEKRKQYVDYLCTCVANETSIRCEDASS